jgi:kynureninase
LRALDRSGDALRSTEGGEVIVDRRPPDVLRVAPVPLYNTFHEVWRAARWIQRAP